MIDRRRFITISSASAAAALVPASSVNAQIAGNAFVVSGFPPGGIGDLIARPMADKMRGRYATNVLVDSKVGAGGRLAVEFVKRANPDGLTILQIPASIMTLYPHIYRNLNYNPLTDFTPVSTTCTYIYSFTASAALPSEIRNVADFISWARANPKRSSYGIPAAGSSLHFAGMLLQRAADFEFAAVPYRGGAPLLADMLAGSFPSASTCSAKSCPIFRAESYARSAFAARSEAPSCPRFRRWWSRAIPTSLSRNGWVGFCLPRRPRLSCNRLTICSVKACRRRIWSKVSPKARCSPDT